MKDLNEFALTIFNRAVGYYAKVGVKNPEGAAFTLAFKFQKTPFPRGLTVREACAAGVL